MLETREEVNRYLDEWKVISKRRTDYALDALDKIRDRELAEKAIASPVPNGIEPSSSTEVVEGGDTKVKKSGEVIDIANRTVCPDCGVPAKSHKREKKKDDGTFSKRWKCTNPDCKKNTFTATSLTSAKN